MYDSAMSRRQPISMDAFEHLCELRADLYAHGFACDRSVLASAIILSIDKDKLVQDFLALAERKAI